MDKPQNTKTTVEMSAPPEWAIGLKGEIVRGFEAVEKRLDAIETNVDLQGNTVRDVQQRMTAQEVRLNGIEERVSNASMRVKQGSQVDMTHESAIATILTKVDALEKRPDTGEQVLAAIDKLSERPLVKRLTSAIVPVMMIAISLIGVWLQQTIARIEQHPAPAPIYQPDAGTR